MKSQKKIGDRKQNLNSLGISFLFKEINNFLMLTSKLSLIINILLPCILIFMFKKQIYFLCYMIEVNQDGVALNSTLLNNLTKMEINEKEVKYFLNNFILNLSTITIDQKVQNMDIKKLNYFLTDETQPKIISFLNDEDLKGKILKKQTINYKIFSIVSD